MKRIVFISFLTTTFIFSNSSYDYEKVTNNNNNNNNVEEVSLDKNIYFEGGIGYSSTSFNTDELSQSINDSSYDENGFSFDIGFGYEFSDNIFSTINYQRINLDSISFNNGYISLNYQFTDMDIKPFIGILGGYSNLTWTEDPIDNVNERDIKSNEYFFGAQIGVSYEINSNWDIYGKYQYNNIKHKTYIEDEVVEHKNNNIFLFGFKYKI